MSGCAVLVATTDSGFNRRLEIRLNGFSSTLSRRDLWRASAREEYQLWALAGWAGQSLTFFGLTQQPIGRHYEGKLRCETASEEKTTDVVEGSRQKGERRLEVRQEK